MNFTTILSETRRFSSTNTTSYTTADITESVNSAFDRVTTLIRQAEGRWQWVDTNTTTLNYALTATVADQQDYTLDSTHYTIERIEVKDTAGNWTKLVPIDQADIYNQSLTDFLSGSGVPQFYDKVGTSLMLYPMPSYAQAASIKVYYLTGPSYFTTSDTTKTPGFNPLFHRLLPLWAAYDYCFIKGVAKMAELEKKIAEMEGDLMEFYSHRDRDEHVRLRARVMNFR